MTWYAWSSSPGTSGWNDSGNWSPPGPPGSADTATFGASSQTQITFSPSTAAQVLTILFNASASQFTFQFGTSSVPQLAIMGGSVVNQSSVIQSFVVSAKSTGIKNPQLVFANGASAGGSRVSYTAGPENAQAAGGGVISFVGNSNAGAASFTAWTGSGSPVEPSTVGGEISFSDTASASYATFNTLGTTGSDGDTFGTVAFHDNSTAEHGTFTNQGGTVSGGDGGNTQFYDLSTAAFATFVNIGATCSGAYGGDVAFDGTSTAGQGRFDNYAATATGGSGGVTSFNNNKPKVDQGGANAGNGWFYNHGAQSTGQGNGGHTEFTGKYGSPSAAWATIVNYGGQASGAAGGYTSFSNTSSAGAATLIAYAGANGGNPGKISFYDASTAGETTVKLFGGELDLGDHTGQLVIGALECNAGTVSIQLGTNLTTLQVWSQLLIEGASPLTFSFWKKEGGGFSPGTPYVVLTASNMTDYGAGNFAANAIDGSQPSFSFSADGKSLLVTY